MVSENERRLARFKEIARDIIWKDRECRKMGMSVDTVGAIARAMNKAFKEGQASAPDKYDDSKALRAEWPDVPSRARQALLSAAIWFHGNRASNEDMALHFALIESHGGRWVFNGTIIDGMREIHDHASRCIDPMVKLGMYNHATVDNGQGHRRRALMLTDDGARIIREGMARGDIGR